VGSEGASVKGNQLSPSGDDDGALMNRVASGEAEALKLIAQRHTPMLYGIAWRMLGDPAEAEDVVQEAITRLWINAKNWTPAGGGLGGWLRRVATNLCLDRKRKHSRMSGEPVPERADDAPAADAMIDEERRRRAVAEAMQRLPDRQRAAIVLTYYEGLSNADAASTLGVGVKALESLLVRARSSLNRRLAGLSDGGVAA